MPQSHHLGLPFLEAGQAQKHVTHNEALRVLDALVQLSVSAVSAAPPESPEEGERHIVAEGASGAFASHDDAVAIYEDGAWRFLPPRAGWRAWCEDVETLLLWNGSEWSALETGGGGIFDAEDIDHIYLNDAVPSDPDVKFAMRGEAALLHAIPAAESGSGDVQLQISKEAAADTASVFFSTNFSGRAEFGLAGSDNFKLKVSADGGSWTEALDIDKSTGRVRLPAVLALESADQAVAFRDIRERLAANRTYYVRSDGSDSNTGLANTSGDAFLTIQKAIDVVTGKLDIATYAVTIQVSSGTYSANLSLKPFVGAGSVLLLGDATTPGNVVISGGTSHAISTGARYFNWAVQGFKVQTTSGGDGINVNFGSQLFLSNVDFGSVAAGRAHLNCSAASYVQFNSNYSISGGAARHWLVGTGSTISCNGKTITLAGTPAFTTAFAEAQYAGIVICTSNTYSGSATGARYAAVTNGLIFTNGAGASALPGSTSGSVATQGQYL